ncbi:MAG: hypothetical protein AW11_01364 [Candidatus Accumulibacter regalis]|uniref:Uncharacterized protein n=1 Tax=Accumulibacter regalis TaxID=522306 RepID=A0A011PQF6_ACCRE|nr:MAG: hypothetical protein AW11_01364 [Candidatus Accumulibacter regalis]
MRHGIYNRQSWRFLVDAIDVGQRDRTVVGLGILDRIDSDQQIVNALSGDKHRLIGNHARALLLWQTVDNASRAQRHLAERMLEAQRSRFFRRRSIRTRTDKT